MHDFQMHAFPLTFLGLKPKNSMDLKVNIIAADDIATLYTDWQKSAQAFHGNLCHSIDQEQ